MAHPAVVQYRINLQILEPQSWRLYQNFQGISKHLHFKNGGLFLHHNFRNIFFCRKIIKGLVDQNIPTSNVSDVGQWLIKKEEKKGPLSDQKWNFCLDL